MRNYSETEIFTPEALTAFHKTTRLVLAIPLLDGENYWRCHELARAVAQMLGCGYADGKFGAVDHSWCIIGGGRKREEMSLLAALIPSTEEYVLNGGCDPILDVYAVGSLPQVQLVDRAAVLRRQYVRGETRKDIRWKAVEELVSCMWLAEVGA